MKFHYFNSRTGEHGFEGGEDVEDRVRWCHGGGDSGGGDQTTTSVPWTGIQPYLKRGYSELEANVLDQPQQFFGGQTYTDFSPQTQQAISQMETRAGSNPLLQQAQQQQAGVAAGDFLDPNSQYMQDTIRSVGANVIPNVQSEFSQAYGRANTPGFYEALGRGFGSQLAPYMSQERARMDAAAQGLPGLAREDYYDISQLGAIGSIQEQQAQRQIDEDMARFQFQQQEPAQRSLSYLSALSGTPMFGSMTTSGGGGGGGGSPWMGAAGGAASGAAMGSALGPWGTLGGAAIGGILGGLGGA